MNLSARSQHAGCHRCPPSAGSAGAMHPIELTTIIIIIIRRDRATIRRYFIIQLFFCVYLVYPHFPQVMRSACSAKNTPLPHFGQNCLERVILLSFTV
jgi:hypothetical protein